MMCAAKLLRNIGCRNKYSNLFKAIETIIRNRLLIPLFYDIVMLLYIFFEWHLVKWMAQHNLKTIQFSCVKTGKR